MPSISAAAYRWLRFPYPPSDFIFQCRFLLHPLRAPRCRPDAIRGAATASSPLFPATETSRFFCDPPLILLHRFVSSLPATSPTLRRCVLPPSTQLFHLQLLPPPADLITWPLLQLKKYRVPQPLPPPATESRRLKLSSMSPHEDYAIHPRLSLLRHRRPQMK